MKRPMTKKKSTKAGREIIAALTDLHETLAAGIPLSERYMVRKVRFEKPGVYDSKSVAATRSRLGVSQTAFAMLVGVSTTLAQSWEQGRRFPSPMARRLLDEINREPARWRKMISVD
jgi:DNA-binding transcriptional regulator YiaG